MRSASQTAPAKVNLALVVGPLRPDGLHELSSAMQRVDLADRVALDEAPELGISGFPEDTIVRDALLALAAATGVTPRWHVRLEKAIPVAAGLGGGSADAAAALRLANETLPEPLVQAALRELAAGIGSDVPFFLEPGPKLVEGAGERLTCLDLPQDYWVVLAVHEGGVKPSTAEVYARFDQLGLAEGFGERRTALRQALAGCRRARDLARLPPNDLGEAAGGSPLVPRLLEAGAFRADVSGAGPTAYGLFEERAGAEAAARSLPSGGFVRVVAPVW